MNPKAPSLIMIGPDGQSLKIHTAYQNPDMWELLEVGNTTLMVASIPLLLSDMSLEQICRQVGYRNYSTFFRAFKQVFHISPREFRKANSRAPLE